LDQTRYIAETWDHESMDWEMIKIFSRASVLCEKGYAIMDCPFVPFHIRGGIAKHVELQNVAGALMD
jgi:hypothetical protein